MSSQLFWTGRRVAITGHTGFKGTWLAHWLVELGAEVTGIALTPPIEPSLFDASGLRRRIDSRIGDVRSRELLARHLNEAQPEIVFYLAAQPEMLAISAVLALPRTYAQAHPQAVSALAMLLLTGGKEIEREAYGD